MKKILLLFAFVLVGINLSAQVQRKIADTSRLNSPSVNNEKEGNPNSSKSIGQRNGLKELNLNKEQKAKLKEWRQVNQSRKDEIMNDPILTEVQKTERLKEIKRSAVVDLRGILTNEQIEKMKAMRAEKTGNNKSGGAINK